MLWLYLLFVLFPSNWACFFLKDGERAKENLKKKEEQMKEKELQRKREREQRVELRKRKIERETVEDDLDRSGFESRHKKSEEVSSKDGAATKRRRSVVKKNLTILFSE